MLDRLVDNGNSLIIIEHNLDMVARADWAIDIGPYAGRDGGKILFEGRPADMINTEASITGQYLRKYRT